VPSGSAKPAVSEIFATGLRQPYGIAFYPPGPNPEWIYIANTDGVVRLPYKNGDLKTSAKPEKIVECIPHVHHWTRDILFSDDGKRLFLSVGSGSNAALDIFPSQSNRPRNSSAPTINRFAGQSTPANSRQSVSANPIASLLPT